MAFPSYLRWARTAEGEQWLSLLRLKWAIVAEARRQDAAEREAGRDDATWRRQGYRGGQCDPHEFSSFDDETAA